jgi:hypothetical protein
VKELILKDIPDEYVRENFTRIKEEIDSQVMLKGKWAFFEITTTQAETSLEIPHGLGFEPKDVIQTNLTSGVTWTWNYSSFTKTHLSITCSGAGTVRAFIGSYRE